MKCYKCEGNIVKTSCIKEGIKLSCMKCRKCGEEFFTSSELARFDVIKGNKSMIRKFGTLGDSTIMRIPPKIIKKCKIKPGDYGVFESRPDGILVRHIHAKDFS